MISRDEQYGTLEVVKYPKDRYKVYDERGKQVHPDDPIHKRSPAAAKYIWEQRGQRFKKEEQMFGKHGKSKLNQWPRNV